MGGNFQRERGCGGIQKMNNQKILFIGIDGLNRRLLDYYSHPFWEELRKNSVIAGIQKPSKIESGEIATASSPRLWARIYTGVKPEKNGILGFWERMTEDGQIQRAEVDLDWIRENRCEKLVDYNDLLVPPIWKIALQEDVSVGLTTPWFSYPLSDVIKELIDKNGNWALTDFPFPMDSGRMDKEKYVYPEEFHPGKEFKEEVGAGARVSILKQNEPVKFYSDLKQQDKDRYNYTYEMLRDGVPNLVQILTRSVDGMQHQFRKEEDCGHLKKEGLDNGEENLKQIYDLQMDQIQKIWNKYDFDHLLINSDHGTSVNIVNGEVKDFQGKDHDWPALFVWHSEDGPSFDGGQMNYEDIVPTILHLLDIEKPDYLEGYSIHAQGQVSERLEDLGYLG